MRRGNAFPALERAAKIGSFGEAYQLRYGIEAEAGAFQVVSG